MASPDFQVARILSVGEAMKGDLSGTGIIRFPAETPRGDLPPLRLRVS